MFVDWIKVRWSLHWTGRHWAPANYEAISTFPNVKIWRGRTLNSGQRWKNCVSHNQCWHQQKAKETLGQRDTLSPRGINYSSAQLLPFPTPHCTSNFSDTKTICSSPTDHVLPPTLCLHTYYSICMEYTGEKMPFHPQVLAQEWILLLNLPQFPQGRLRNTFPVHSLPTPPQEPTSPFYPLSHSKNYFFKCPAQRKRI